MTEQRCASPICVMVEGVRGRMFTPPDNAQGTAQVWCSECLRLGNQLVFFSHETAEMIRNVYKSYIDTNLPKEVKLFLEQFTREIINNLNEEL